MQAALGLSQLNEIEKIIKKKIQIHKEYKKMFDYIIDNFGTIDIKDKRFMIESSGKEFFAYPHWEKIMAQSVEYRT